MSHETAELSPDSMEVRSVVLYTVSVHPGEIMDASTERPEILCLVSGIGWTDTELKSVSVHPIPQRI